MPLGEGQGSAGRARGSVSARGGRQARVRLSVWALSGAGKAPLDPQPLALGHSSLKGHCHSMRLVSNWCPRPHCKGPAVIVAISGADIRQLLRTSQRGSLVAGGRGSLMRKSGRANSQAPGH